MNFGQVCLQIKLLWIGIGLVTIFCGVEHLGILG